MLLFLRSKFLLLVSLLTGGCSTPAASSDEPAPSPNEPAPSPNEPAPWSDAGTTPHTADGDAMAGETEGPLRPSDGGASQLEAGTTPDVSSAPPMVDTDAAPTPIEPPNESPDASTPAPVRNYLPCDIERIFAERCWMCHSRRGSGQEPLLESWSQISTEADLILEVVLEGFMPMLPPPLTQEQKNALTAWVENGAPALSQADAPDCSG